MAVRAVRGATQVDVDEREHVLEITRQLVARMLELNDLTNEDVVSILFSATRDIRSVAPAMAARQLGIDEAALLCVQEMDVVDGMPRVVRLMAHVDTELKRSQVRNVYLRGTGTLRDDVPPVTVVRSEPGE